MNKYIYILDIKFQGIVKYCYLDKDIYNNFYYSLEEAIEHGKDLLKDALKRTASYLNMDIKDILDIVEYSFIIKQVSCNYIKFNEDNEREEYYKNNISNITKENLYDFLLSILNYVEYTLDLDGNITYNSCNDNFYLDFRSFKYPDKYHLNKFKIGDKVKYKYHTEKIYEIAEILNKDSLIYNSKDPLYFRQGYILTDIYDDYCNKYSYLAFDEDLLESSDEEYYNYYKSYDWYDGNNIIGTYDDYINNRI